MAPAQVTDSAVLGPARHVRRRAVLLGAAGNLAANFDGAIFAYLAPVLAQAFYPDQLQGVALLLTLASYATGFLMKPLGAILFGTVGDRLGRKPSLYLSIALMAVSSCIVTVLPDYATMGFAAPVLLVLARLLEGISAGGEYGIASAYLVEFAPRTRRAYVSSSQQVTMMAGTLLASGVATLLTSTLREHDLLSWGWRLPFAAGTVLCVVTAVLRSRVAETPSFTKIERASTKTSHPVWNTLRQYPLASLRAVALSAAGIVVYHVWLQFLPTFAHSTTGIGLHTAQLANTACLAVMLPLIPACAKLSDRFGRRPTMLVFAVGMGVLAYPLLLALHLDIAGFLIAQLGGTVLLSFNYANESAVKAELFPTQVRAVGLSFPYALAGAVFGSISPLLTGYFANTGDSLPFALCISATCLLPTLVLLRMPETKSCSLETNPRADTSC